MTCFTGSHTGLAVMAALMLALCALAIIISFILSLYHTEVTHDMSLHVFSQILQRIVWLKRLSRAVRYPFKHQYRWWYSVELARRFVIVLITVLFPQNNVSKRIKIIDRLPFCTVSQSILSVYLHGDIPVHTAIHQYSC